MDEDDDLRPTLVRLYGHITHGIRPKTFRNLCWVAYWLNFNAEIRERVWDRVRAKSLGHMMGNFYECVKPEDVQEIVQVSSRTAHDIVRTLESLSTWGF